MKCQQQARKSIRATIKIKHSATTPFGQAATSACSVVWLLCIASARAGRCTQKSTTDLQTLLLSDDCSPKSHLQ